MSFIRNNFQKIFLGLIIIILIAVVALRGDQLQELIETMKGGEFIPLILALVTQLCKYFAQSFAYSFSFKAVGEKMKAREMLPLVFGTFFMNTIAPSMNLAGTTLVVDDARRRGIDPGKSTSAALLMQITIDGAFTTVMIAAFTLLLCTVGIQPLWLLMGGVVVALVATMVFVLVMANKKPKYLRKVFGFLERLLNKILVKVKLKPLKPWAERIAENFSEASRMIGHNKRAVLAAYLCSLVASICELTCFALVGIAFAIYSPEPLICGYVVATLFAMISITPQGVGVVEAMVVVAFTAYGENAAAGAATALVYRGIVFWMPFLVGAILMTRTKTFKGTAKKSVKDVVDARDELIENRELDLGVYGKDKDKAKDKEKESGPLDESETGEANTEAVIDGTSKNVQNSKDLKEDIAENKVSVTEPSGK